MKGSRKLRLSTFLRFNIPLDLLQSFSERTGLPTRVVVNFIKSVYTEIVKSVNEHNTPEREAVLRALVRIETEKLDVCNRFFASVLRTSKLSEYSKYVSENTYTLRIEQISNSTNLTRKEKRDLIIRELRLFLSFYERALDYFNPILKTLVDYMPEEKIFLTKSFDRNQIFHDPDLNERVKKTFKVIERAYGMYVENQISESKLVDILTLLPVRNLGEEIEREIQAFALHMMNRIKENLAKSYRIREDEIKIRAKMKNVL